MPRRLSLIIWSPILVLMSLSAIADPGSPPSRAWALGLSATRLFSESVLGSSPVAPGLNATYEFLVSPRFSLGLHAAYRSHAGRDLRLSQFTYGALLKHAFGDANSSVRPFLEYGLLLNMNFLSDRMGSGVSHNTKLSGGLEFDALDERWNAGLAYHYSRLSYFGGSKLKLDALELQLAWTRRW